MCGKGGKHVRVYKNSQRCRLLIHRDEIPIIVLKFAQVIL